MIYLTIAFSMIWVFTLVHAQHHQRNKLAWRDDVISDYIAHDLLLQIGFVALAVGLAAAAWHFNQWAFLASGLGALGVMLTMKRTSGKLHIACAVTTFLAALIGCALAAKNQLLLGMAIGNILLAAFALVVQDEAGDAERYLACALISWFIAATIL